MGLFDFFKRRRGAGAQGQEDDGGQAGPSVQYVFAHQALPSIAFERPAGFLGGTDTLRGKPKPTPDGDEIRTPQLDSNTPSLEVRVLDISQHTVGAVIEQHDNNRSVFLTGDGKFSDVDQQAAIATQRNDRLLRSGQLHTDRHR